MGGHRGGGKAATRRFGSERLDSKDNLEPTESERMLKNNISLPPIHMTTETEQSLNMSADVSFQSEVFAKKRSPLLEKNKLISSKPSRLPERMEEHLSKIREGSRIKAIRYIGAVGNGKRSPLSVTGKPGEAGSPFHRPTSFTPYPPSIYKEIGGQKDYFKKSETPVFSKRKYMIHRAIDKYNHAPPPSGSSSKPELFLHTRVQGEQLRKFNKKKGSSSQSYRGSSKVSISADKVSLTGHNVYTNHTKRTHKSEQRPAIKKKRSPF